jgi:hypothetical protein
MTGSWPLETPPGAMVRPLAAVNDTPAVIRTGNGPAHQSDVVRDEICLLGQPPLRRYLNFMRDEVVGGESADRRALVDEWRRVNDYYGELEESEAGIADKIEVLDLDHVLAPLVAEAMADPRYRHAFDTFPTSFAWVELDRLVIYQTRVTQQFVEALKSRLGPAPDPETLFRFCLPPECPGVPVEIRRIGQERYVFACESTDFRFLDAALLRPDQVRDYASAGPISGVVGLVVGFGSNFLTAIRHENRLVLHNGYHRACALRALGITHAPCIIQTVTRRDELQVAAKRTVAEDPAFYFVAKRPPLLKDFFDPRIRRVLRVHKTLTMIEVSFEVQEHGVRA